MSKNKQDSASYKVGTDIIEVDRIKEAMQDKNFAKRVFTDKEIEYCESKKANKFQSFAARFAAKEAIFKAISSYLDNKFEIEWKDIEVLNDENGRPYVNVVNKNKESLKNIIIDVSLAHLGAYAVSTAIVMKES